MSRGQGGATYRNVLAVREFRFMWLAEVLSVAGDQLARVALSLLVFERTGSAALTGLTYGLTFVPTLFGSVFLSGLADHYPRRNVMIGCDAVRMATIALITVPGVPLWLLCVLVAASTLFNGPFKAAQQALLPEVLPEHLYILGMSLRTVSSQVAQLAGFALGGGLVALLSPEGGLLADAGSFALSGLLLLCIAARPVQRAAGERALSPRGLARGAASYVADKRLLVLAGVVALNLFFIVPEGIAAPYARALGVGDYAVALILASAPLGGALGAFVFGRLVPEDRRPVLLGPVAIAAGVVLVPTLFPIGLLASLLLFVVAGGLSGVFTMYAAAMVPLLAPSQNRGRVSGLLGAIVHTANGLGPMVGGLVAASIGPAAAIAAAGAVSAVLAVGLSAAWSHLRHEEVPAAAEQPAG